jgi:hypothetical protein
VNGRPTTGTIPATGPRPVSIKNVLSRSSVIRLGPPRGRGLTPPLPCRTCSTRMTVGSFSSAELILALRWVELMSALFMTGLIWFVQAVHYPLLTSFGADSTAYQSAHMRRTTQVVAAPMLAELNGASSWPHCCVHDHHRCSVFPSSTPNQHPFAVDISPNWSAATSLTRSPAS